MVRASLGMRVSRTCPLVYIYFAGPYMATPTEHVVTSKRCLEGHIHIARLLLDLLSDIDDTNDYMRTFSSSSIRDAVAVCIYVAVGS